MRAELRVSIAVAGLLLAFLGYAAQGSAVKGKDGKMGLPAQTEPARINPAVVLANDPDWRSANTELYRDQRTLDIVASRLTGTGVDRYVLRRGVGNAKRIALTFDDGPHPDYTPKLLDLLRGKGVKATFFVIGHMVDKYPDLVRRESTEGHEIANHTYSHVTLTKIPAEEVSVEYQANNDAIRRVTGKPVRYCRPPGGDHNAEVLRRAATLGLTTVLWTDDPGDYLNPAASLLLDDETRTLSAGGIVLLHDGSQSTLDTLARFIDAARAKGYRFVSLDELRVGEK